MATHNVSTWAELASAIRNASGGDTIKLVDDINCNNEIPQGVESTVSCGQLSSLTIDGSYEEDGVTKNHIIYNLRTSLSNPVSIFQLSCPNYNYTKTIKNITFVNLILNAPLLYMANGGTYSHTFTIRNCNFVGKRYDYLFGCGTQTGIILKMYQCFINVPYYGTTQAKAAINKPLYSQNAIIYNSRVREYFNDTYTPSTNDSDVTCGVYNIAVDGCRIEGEVVGGKYARYHSSNAISSFTPSTQNVYDVDFKLTNTGEDSVPLYAHKGVIKSPITRKDDETIAYTISSQSTGTILATESQMKDAQWLHDQNFDIIVPSQGE